MSYVQCALYTSLYIYLLRVVPLSLLATAATVAVLFSYVYTHIYSFRPHPAAFSLTARLGFPVLILFIDRETFGWLYIFVCCVCVLHGTRQTCFKKDACARHYVPKRRAYSCSTIPLYVRVHRVLLNALPLHGLHVRISSIHTVEHIETWSMFIPPGLPLRSCLTGRPPCHSSSHRSV